MGLEWAKQLPDIYPREEVRVEDRRVRNFEKKIWDLLDAHPAATPAEKKQLLDKAGFCTDICLADNSLCVYFPSRLAPELDTYIDICPWAEGGFGHAE